MQEGNEEPFNVRLHLAKDILTIQEQDVICVSGEPFYSSVSKSFPWKVAHCAARRVIMLVFIIDLYFLQKSNVAVNESLDCWRLLCRV